MAQRLERSLVCLRHGVEFLLQTGRGLLKLMVRAGRNLPLRLAQIGHSRLAFKVRCIGRAIRHAWFPVLISVGSFWLLGFPGLAFFQVQQTLVNTLFGPDHFVGCLPVAGSVAAVGMLAITLSAWSTRLIPNFYRAGDHANMSLLVLVMVIGMGPPLGFALCAMSVAALPDVEASLGRAGQVLAASVALAGLLERKPSRLNRWGFPWGSHSDSSCLPGGGRQAWSRHCRSICEAGSSRRFRAERATARRPRGSGSARPA